ncbi:hypothetical protein [Dongshaea marina]|uniref:hypothetical protein n=1 Tax=Dongshaea marina TaxID=2047966 RepID=UPI000D3E8FBC|nr:hypothetical protein [Dongshaea marina]
MKKMTKTLVATAFVIGLPLSVYAATNQSDDPTPPPPAVQQLDNACPGSMMGQRGPMMHHGKWKKGEQGPRQGMKRMDPVAYQKHLERKLSQIKDPQLKQAYLKIEKQKLTQAEQQLKAREQIQLQKIELMKQILAKQA